MPIKIADGLDAVSELKKEGIVTIGEKRARTQDIRPLHILILNLMPICTGQRILDTKSQKLDVKKLNK